MLQNVQIYNKNCAVQIILGLQLSVQLFYVSEQEGLLSGATQGKTRRSSKRSVLTAWSQTLHVSKSSKKTNSQFGPIRISTFTDVLEQLC